jgi:hypothetical protein
MGDMIEDCTTQSVGDRCVPGRFVLEKEYKMLHEERKKDRTVGGQVPLYTQIPLSNFNTKIPYYPLPFPPYCIVPTEFSFTNIITHKQTNEHI